MASPFKITAAETIELAGKAGGGVAISTPVTAPKSVDALAEVLRYRKEGKFGTDAITKTEQEMITRQVARRETMLGRSLTELERTSEEEKVKLVFSVGFDTGGLISKAPKIASKEAEVITKYLTRVDSESVQASRKSVGTVFSELYRHAIDRFNPIVNVTREAQKLGTISPGKNPELLARRYLGVRGMAESKLTWKTWELGNDGFLKVTGDGLQKILHPVKSQLDDLRALLVAEREIELAGRKIETGFAPGSSEAVMDALKTKWGDRYKDLEQVSIGVRSYAKRAILDPLRAVGAISDEVYTAILKSNKFYTPFQRVMDEIEQRGTVTSARGLFQAANKPLKQIEGSKRTLIDPLESLITNTYKTTDYVERARVAQSIVNLRNLGGDLAESIVPVKEAGKDTIAVLENGVRKYYRVEEDLAKLMNQLSLGESNIVWKMLGLPARTLRAGATLAPEFIGRNPIRDQFSAMIQSKYGYRPVIDLIDGVWSIVGREDIYGKWLASGGAQSLLVSLDRLASQKTLQQLVQKTAIEYTPKGIIKTLNPLRALQAISAGAEKGTRLGVFTRALKSGASDLEAAFDSREATLDFGRIGASMREVNSIVAFFNARLQGIDRIVRATKARPFSTTAKILSGVTAPSVALYYMNRSDPRYKEIPRWQKDIFWIVLTDDTIYRIPKPFEVGVVFGSVPERILEWIDTNEPGSLDAIASTVLQDFGPETTLPTAILPWIENSANYKFFTDRPIVGQAVAGLPAELQDMPYTSETARMIGRFIKSSPAKIENVVLSYTGGLGRYALSAADSILKKSGLVAPPPLPESTLADMPFIRAFVVRDPIGSNSESVNKFFEELGRLESVEQAAKQLAEKGRIRESSEYIRENPNIFMAKSFRNVAKKMSQLRQVKDLIFQSRTISPEEKRSQITAIDELITEMAVQTLSISLEAR